MTTVKMLVLAALAVGWAFADGPWVVTSSDTVIDMRLWTACLAEEDGEADTRSFSDAWSAEGQLDTRVHRGTIILVK
jgi:hypothetical protein